MSVTGQEDPVASANEKKSAGKPASEVQYFDRQRVRLELLWSLTVNELEALKLIQSQLIDKQLTLEEERLKQLASDAPEEALIVFEQRLAEIEFSLVQLDEDRIEVVQERLSLEARLEEVLDPTSYDDSRQKPSIERARKEVDDDIFVNGLGGDEFERLQEALIYFGGYDAAIDGAFGPRSLQAVRRFQTSSGLEPSGVLSADEKKVLLARAEKFRRRYDLGWLRNLKAGYELIIPRSLFSRRENNEQALTSADGRKKLQLTVGRGSRLGPLFEDALASYGEISYSRRRSDWFVISAEREGDEQLVYDVARLANDRVIRAQLFYEAKDEDFWSPFTVLLFNSFRHIEEKSK